MMAIGGPNVLRSSPWRLCRKSGSQKRNIHQTGSVRNLPKAKAHVSLQRSNDSQGILAAESGGSRSSWESSASDRSFDSRGRRYSASEATSQTRALAHGATNA